MENKQGAAIVISAAIIALGMVLTAWVFQYGNAYNSCYRNAVATITSKAFEKNFFDQFDAPEGSISAEELFADETIKEIQHQKRNYALGCSSTRN